MSRRLLTSLTLILALAAPAAAQAADETLLSGYGGPGGGEQAVLGSKLLPAKKGNGSLRAPARSASAAQPAAAAPVAAAPSTSAPSGGTATTSASGGGTATTTRSSGGKRGGGTAARGSRTAKPGSTGGKAGSSAKGTKSSAAASATSAATPQAPASVERVAYPASAGASSIVGPDLSLVFLGLLALLLVGLAVSRIARTAAPDALPPRPLL